MFLFFLVFAMFCARLFICALWSPAGKGLTSQQTCLYGSHMGYPYWTHMGSATGFCMGPIWVSPYAGYPVGSHMGPM